MNLNSNAFKVANGTACYRVTRIDADTATCFGCPDATHVIETVGGYVLGYFTETGRVLGKSVRVPGWTAARKGVRVTFHADTDPNEPFYAVDGYLGD